MRSRSTRRISSATRWARRPREPRSEKSRGKPRDRARERQDVCLELDGGGRQDLRRRADPAVAEVQGPARLRAFHQDAERAFTEGPCPDDGKSPGQAADAAGDGG